MVSFRNTTVNGSKAVSTKLSRIPSLKSRKRLCWKIDDLCETADYFDEQCFIAYRALERVRRFLRAVNELLPIYNNDIALLRRMHEEVAKLETAFAAFKKYDRLHKNSLADIRAEKAKLAEMDRCLDEAGL